MLTASFAVLMLAAAPFEDADNLAGNPGFEILTADAPAQWDVFLLPQEGAFARLDGEAHTGKHAVIIHVPVPHPSDPVNNWSQNLFGDFGGREFRVAGHVKTVEARDAAIWVQCWRKRPLRLLETATTAATSPIFGTRDWERVETTFTAPAGTDFMTVRCVLRGQGTVWFDDIFVGRQAPSPPEEPAEEAEESVPGNDTTPRVDEEHAPAPAPATSTPTPPPPASAAPAQDSADAARLRTVVEELRQSNDALLQEVLRLREEVLELTRKEERSESMDTLLSPWPETAPPLVPFGEDWRSLL